MRFAAWRETLAWAGPLLAAAAGCGVLLLAGAGDSQASPGRPAASAGSASTGAAKASSPAAPRTRAEAAARHHTRLQTCQALSLAAVRAECERQSARTLALEIAALPAAADRR